GVGWKAPNRVEGRLPRKNSSRRRKRSTPERDHPAPESPALPRPSSRERSFGSCRIAAQGFATRGRAPERIPIRLLRRDRGGIPRLRERREKSVVQLRLRLLEQAFGQPAIQPLDVELR